MFLINSVSWESFIVTNFENMVGFTDNLQEHEAVQISSICT